MKAAPKLRILDVFEIEELVIFFPSRIYRRDKGALMKRDSFFFGP